MTLIGSLRSLLFAKGDEVLAPAIASVSEEIGAEAEIVSCAEVLLSKDKLIAVADELELLSRSTESDFLLIGGKLNDLSEGCSRNSGFATSIIQMVEGGEGFKIGAMQALFNKAFENTGSCSGAITTGIDDMRYLGERLGEIHGLSEFLEGLSKSINVIGILSRIETSRLEGSDFSSMTAVVDDLALQIAKSTTEVAISGSDVKKSISLIVGDMTLCSTAFARDIELATARMHSILDEMESMKNRASWACRRIEGRSAQMIPEIGKVIAALQYHDICRQQMEHVCNALREIAARSAEASQSPDSAIRKSARKWLWDVIRIQMSQLDNVVSQAGSAATGIAVHLTRISDLAEAQAEDSSSILDEEASGSDVIEKIRNELEELAFITGRCKKMTQEMLDAVTDASDRIALMTGHITNIKTISENISLLAINAIIKVARTGEKGRALEVLADRIQLLARDAKDEIERGAGIIESILGKASEFRANLSGVLNNQLAAAQAITEESLKAGSELMEADKELLASMAEISAVTNTLKDDVKSLVEGIQFNERMRSDIGRFITGLNDIAEALDREAGGTIREESAELPPELLELERQYTMESEREVHNAIMAAGRTPQDISNNGGESSGAEEDDNITLF
ncbi:MAG: methyl-accepting chemotaxis protein [Nitrospirae bacterium]|nr:methyl-accepting chemotaxis protein [Nitrospirota bacterium]